MSETEIHISQILPSVSAYDIIGTNSGATANTYLSLVAGSNITITPSGNTLTIASTGGGGGGSPAGSDTQIQYNAAGSFGANTGFTFIPDTGAGSNLTLGGDNGTEIIFSNSDQSVNYGEIAGQINGSKQILITVAPSQYIFTPTELQVSAAGIELLANAYVEFDDGGSNSVSIAAPGTVNTTYNLFLPSDQGAANSILQNDGSGNLSWTPVVSIVNVLSTTSTTQDTTTSSSFVVAPDYTVSVTPRSTSSRFLIQVDAVVSVEGSTAGHATIMRDSTILLGSDGFGGSNIDTTIFGGADTGVSMSVVDSPNTTSTIVYSIGICAQSGDTMRIGDSDVYGSTITVTEFSN